MGGSVSAGEGASSAYRWAEVVGSQAKAPCYGSS